MHEEQAAPETREAFTMDPNLLVSVIRSQAGTVAKALLEGVMNSLDAGATRVDLRVNRDGFTLEDNGRGFANEEEIRLWFGRFGTPHEEGDAMYGRFRMGRGQIFSHAASVWSSNRFQLSVDINRRGLNYGLQMLDTAVRGCKIEATFYETLTDEHLAETLIELKKFVAFTPRPVYVNGTLYGAPASRLKTWTSETDDAWVRLTSENEELLVYNQGVFVCAYPSWKVGLGGIIVSKHRLEVNFARNSVMENRCEVWRRIRQWLEALVFIKLTRSSRLSDGERSFLARRVHTAPAAGLAMLRQAKLLTDVTGKHLPLDTLKDVHTLVYCERPTALACELNGNGFFVVTDRLIERFGTYSFEDFFERLRQVPDLLRDDVRTQSVPEAAQEQSVDEFTALDAEALTRKQQAALQALIEMNAVLGRELRAVGRTDTVRTILVARQKKNTAIAWTDGKSYITANVRRLRDFEEGVDGILRWAFTLLHEYMHNQDDSESHEHGEVFFRQMHDALFESRINLASLTQTGLAAYLQALRKLGAHRPQKLTRQLARQVPSVPLEASDEDA